MRNNFKNIFKDDLQEIVKWAIDVNRNRLFDIEDFSDLQQNTSRILPVPASSSDIKGFEKEGDIAADASYLYYVTESGGSLVWRRIASSSF